MLKTLYHILAKTRIEAKDINSVTLLLADGFHTTSGVILAVGKTLN